MERCWRGGGEVRRPSLASLTWMASLRWPPLRTLPSALRFWPGNGGSLATLACSPVWGPETAEPLAAPKVGSDSVMMSLAKKSGDMISKVITGKESKNKPPEEVKL